jgi:3-deoxy-D-manno-octulosonate 8-phosphate phosphatase (KDO 8-P phosphatase)
MDKNYKEKLQDIRALIFDVDGVMTDGSLILMPDGEQIRTMNIKDGYAMQLAVKAGFRVAVISGRKSEGVIKRLQNLGIFDLYMGVDDKMSALDEFLLTYEIKKNQVLYMGDDIPDLEVMKKVGIPACPKDAAEEIKQISQYVSSKKGGEGCVRDVIEQLMRIQGLWPYGKKQ